VTAEESDPDPASDQYFAERPRTSSARSELRFLYRGDVLHFLVDRGVFASHGLDPGTALLIENLTVRPTDRVLDLGCGWGAVGVAAARSASRGHVVMTEVNRRAARLARLNLERNRVENAEVRVGPTFEPVREETFDVIATNPPYRAGRPVVLEMLEGAPAHLTARGKLVLVGKGSQGIRYYQDWLDSHWEGPVEVLGRGSGYRVLEARREPKSRHP
jgi:16S rRNA (guanine1207-N2)-methyltransferase